MSIVIIGGNCGMHRLYKDICTERGHDVKVFTKLTTQFAKNIGSPDAVLFFVNNISHKMVRTAKNEMKRKNIPCMHCTTCSAQCLRSSIEELEKNMI